MLGYASFPPDYAGPAELRTIVNDHDLVVECGADVQYEVICQKMLKGVKVIAEMWCRFRISTLRVGDVLKEPTGMPELDMVLAGRGKSIRWARSRMSRWYYLHNRRLPLQFGGQIDVAQVLKSC